MNSSQQDPATLILDPKHPGINDIAYITRRTQLFNIARDYRLSNRGIPLVQYTTEENAIWQFIYEHLDEAHQIYACDFYRLGKQRLNFTAKKMPEIFELSATLNRDYGFSLVAAEGLIPPRAFFAYLSKRIMPCTQYLRHGSHPSYTPEPDAVHDIIGHIPPLLHPEYAELIALIGEGVKQADDHELLAWEKIYWFTIEFGLIEEKDSVKSFGAGLFSSYEEMQHAFSTHVQLKPFDLEAIIHNDYDPTRLQEIFYVIPSIKTLHQALEKFLQR